MRRITEIIVHATATRPEWWAGRKTADKVAEVRRWHVSGNGWRDIGYHYLIDRTGYTMAGRPLDQTGAHVQGRNTGTIGIALFGGHGSAETDAFGDHFTPDQDKALRKLIAELQAKFGPVPVTGHNQYAAKACPGFNVPKWFAGGNAPQRPAAAPVARPAAPSPQPAQKPATGLLAALWRALVALFNRRK